MVTAVAEVHDVRMESIPIGDKPAESEDETARNVFLLPGAELPSDEASKTSETGGQEEVSESDAEEDLSYEEALARDAPSVEDDAPTTAPANAEFLKLIEQGTQVLVGLISSAASAVSEAVRSTSEEEPTPTTEPAPEPSEPLTKVAGAALGATVTAAELGAKAVNAAARSAEPLTSWVTNPPFMRGATDTLGGALGLMDGRWKAADADAERAASAFVKSLVPQITASALEQIDLTAIVREHVDLNEVVQDLDIDAIVGRVDINAIVDRLDMERLVAKLPIDAVMDRVDVNEIVASVDMEALIQRLDMPKLAQDVIDEIGLTDIIRESSGAMASETVQTLRVGGMRADTWVAHVVDRVLFRKRDRALAFDVEPEEPSTR